MAIKHLNEVRYQGMELLQVIKKNSDTGKEHLENNLKYLYASNKSSLTEKEIEEVEKHIKKCGTCRGEIRTIKGSLNP